MATTQTLAQKLKLNVGSAKIVFVGVPELSGAVSSDGEAYYTCFLKEPIKVRCSTSPSMPVLETDQLHIRESALTSDKWQYVDAAKPEKGFWMEGWVADFSVNQKIAIYQETTILKYVRNTRDQRRGERDEAAKGSIMQMIEDFKKRKEGK
jgi:hypothetical protein